MKLISGVYFAKSASLADEKRSMDMSTAKSLVLLATSLLASCASTDGPKTPAESGGGSPGALAPALISNEFITLGVLPHAGAHIVELKYKDGPNMLLSDESFWTKAPPAPSAEKPEFLNLNGHITWLAPQKGWWTQQNLNPAKRDSRSPWPPDPFLTLGKYEILSHDESSVELRGPESPVSGLQLTVKISLHGNKVHLGVSARNISGSDVSWGLWSNTRLPGSSKFYLPCRTEQIKSLRFECNSWSPQKDRLLNFKMENGFLTFDIEEAAKFPEHASTNKVFIKSESKSLVVLTGKFLFIKTLDTEVLSVHPDHAPLEVFQSVGAANPPLLEIEAHGDYRTLKPGESMSLDETWEIIPCAGDKLSGAGAVAEFLKSRFF